LRGDLFPGVDDDERQVQVEVQALALAGKVKREGESDLARKE